MTAIEPTARPGTAPVEETPHGTPAARAPAGVAKEVRQATRGVYRMHGHMRAIRMTLNALLILALLYTVTLVKALIIPLVLAAFIGLALNPIVARGTRHHIPRWLGASVLMVTLITAIASGIGMLTEPALTWLHTAPSQIRSFIPKLQHFTRPLEAAGRATQALVNGHPTLSAQNPSDVAISVWDVLANTPKVLAAVLTVLLLVYFFLVYGDLILRRLVEIAPNFGYKRHAVSIVRGIQTEVSRYILTTIVINVSLGVTTAGMLYVLHMPDPLLWGTVAMFANFIPYVGAIVTTTTLLFVGLIHFEVLTNALLPAVCFACITAVEGNLITPWILGRRMRVSPIAILIWLLIWGWLWGVPGALLAVPMLTSAKLIAERVRGWEWFARMVQR
ncbi:AI-2E family transporter [Dyella nitratireducens]|uniref:AI-2E family transporter n=1 Tax=Dyella nitratireducens TaxID=1849580 RepID=A0ABQ1FX23_9GAMM|nr:AI-2E family transporter [Dyella nitratireducens]GGA31302.1 AI-2E family transporter [Dyella nitratireducens]GLQ42890.1 AI-2E family transporter [Dyella nitratireducens]